MQAPADHRCLDGSTRLMIAPSAIDEAAGEWQLIRAAMVFAQHLDRLIGRWFSLPIEFGQPSFTRRHFRRSPPPSPSARLAFTHLRPGLGWKTRPRNPNARMRFPCGILTASPRARNNLTGQALLPGGFDDRPDRARARGDGRAFDAVPVGVGLGARPGCPRY